MLTKFVAKLGWLGQKDTAPVRCPKRVGDVGYDLCARLRTEIPRGITWVSTGVAIEAHWPLWYSVIARSSLHKRGLFVCPGTIDAGYQGEVLVAIGNMGDTQYINQGEYIAQCVFFNVVQPGLREVTEFQPSERGINGFGSTDR